MIAKMPGPNVWFLVPARSGSRRLPRKNLRLLRGAPLVTHVVKTLTEGWPPERTVVMTDCPEIASVVKPYGVVLFMEEPTTGSATLDNVAVEACRRLLASGAALEDLLLTVQPTSPLISRNSIRNAIDTLGSGASTVISVIDDRHLRWRLNSDGKAQPIYARRLNSQELPLEFRETGGIIGARIGQIVQSGSRIAADHVELIEVGPMEGLDIDVYADFVLAQHYLNRRNIVIRADGSRNLGLGHIFRALTLANELAAHQPVLITRCDQDHDLGYEILKSSPHPVHPIRDNASFLPLLRELKSEIVFLDVLDTAAEFIRAIKSVAKQVVTFEDMGDGAALADLVINDLYQTAGGGDRVLTGIANALLAPGFELIRKCDRPTTDVVNRVLVLFGGTDPSGLTETALMALEAIEYKGEVLVVLGPGRMDRPINLEEYGLNVTVRTNVGFMAEVMQSADLAISSGGRSVTELMTVGVPTIVMCQNRRELLHTHASMAYGVMNLGLGRFVAGAPLERTLRLVIEDVALRRNMQQLMLNATRERSNHAIIERIERRLGIN